VLKIELLGTPSLTLDDTPLPVTRRKSRALLYYLAAHMGGTGSRAGLSRDHLLAFFWPDLERSQGQQTLRTTLHGLRKALGGALVIEEDTLSLSPETWVDVREFAGLTQEQKGRGRTGASAEQLTAALELYRGEFLAGFSLPEPASFDDWAATEREHYRRLVVRGLTTLSQLQEAAGDYGVALDTLERALAFDPLQEDLQREAMRLNYWAGDRAAAIRRYDTFRKLLDEEMGVPPMAETRATYDGIINDTLAAPKVVNEATKTLEISTSADSTSPSNEGTGPLPFTGREAELETLRGLSSTGKLALLEGEPGIGKTRLAEEFIKASNSIGLIGRARELEGALPYQPFIEALRLLLARTDWPELEAALLANVAAIWLAQVARLLPELDLPLAEEFGSSTVTDESRLWEGLHQFLKAVAAQHPVVIFIDDMQWADSATLALLGYLIRQSTPNLFYLAASRAVAARSPLATLLQTLTRENRFAHLQLQRLTSQQIAVLTQNICGDQTGSFTDWLANSSEGNPYVLSELMRYARDNGLISGGQVNAEALSKSPVVPQTIYTLTQARLDKLSETARRVFDAAVAAGREFEFEIVYRAAGISEAAALDAIDELSAAALIHAVAWITDKPAKLMYAIDHSITMEVAYREIGEARHRVMHRRVAEAYAAVYGRSRKDTDDARAGLIAWHFSEGNDEEQAAPYALRAGRRAMRLVAWREAADFFAQALEADLDEADQLTANMELGEALIRAGEAARATEAFRAAVEVAEDSDAANLARIALARSLFMQARFGEAVAAMKQVQTENLNIAAQREFTWGAALSIEGADLTEATQHLQNADLLLNQAGAPSDLPVLAQVRFELGSIAAQQGDLVEATRLYREALDIAEESPEESAVFQQVLANNNLAYHLHLLHDPAAKGYAEAGLALAQQKGVLPLQAFLFSTLGEIALAANDLDGAEHYFNEGMLLAERLNIPERMAGLMANLGLAALARGKTELAIFRLSTALTRADGLGTKHLAANIRLWLAPLLPEHEAQVYLAEVRAFAEGTGRKRLLAEVMELEKKIHH
jgi:DNA-binding SARP family transcriptional activator